MADWFTLARPLLHRLPPETVHTLGLWALQNGLWPSSSAAPSKALEVNAFGLHFKNPIGLAAGFDKNAVAIHALLAQGLGFVEAGTVTPKPQPGNPRPRVFRLPEDSAVINRLGFNNNGVAAFVDNFQRTDRGKGIAGVNIGKNKDSDNAVSDYVIGMEAVYPYADYITVNISSPNTPGLRNLQNRDALTQLLGALQEMRAKQPRRVPILLKIAPDLEAKDKESIAEVVLSHHIDGLIVSNTTISRPYTLKSRHCMEQGGLSGKPLFVLSTETLKDFYRLTGGKIPLIGVGGISSAEDAYTKIRAGATLVQLYTAIIYRGFSVVREIQEGLLELLKKDGLANVQQAVGVDAK